MNRTLFLLTFCTFAFSEIILIPGYHSTIQKGIDFSVDGDTILVETGTYPENVNFNGKNVIVLSHFCYDESPDSTFLTSTIIDGYNNGSVVTFESGESTTTQLCGFTIRNGSAYDGGGIYIDHASPHIKSNIIENNFASHRGGGIYKIKGRGEDIPTLIEANIIKNNSVCSSCYGGGIYINLASTVLYQNEITGNSAYRGGGIYIIQANPELIDNKINANLTTDDGAGIYMSRSNAKFINVEMTENSGYYALYIYCSDPHLVKSSIYANPAGGIKLSCGEDEIDHQLSTSYNHFISYPEFNSSYIYSNTGAELTTSTSSTYGDNSFEMKYTNIEGGCPYLSDLYSETCDENSGNFGECSDCMDINCLSKGDPALPKNSDGTDTNIGYCDNFDWDWEEIWLVNYDHFSHLIWDIQFNMPGINSNGYNEPTNSQLETWKSIITDIQNSPDLSSLDQQLDDFNYELIYDDPNYPAGYYIMYEKFPVQHGWGTFVYNSNSNNNLQIHVSHPIYDFNTHIIGAKAFQSLNAQWFIMAGAHRYSNCSDNGSQCSQSDDCESDMARNQNSVFQKVFEAAVDGCDYTLSIHAFSGSSHTASDFINLTHGSTDYCQENMIVTNVVDEYCSYVEDYPGTTCCHTSASNDCDDLGGTTNPQGIFINNSAYAGQWVQVEIDVGMTPIEDAYSMFIDNSAIFFNSLNIDQECVINGCTDITACNYDTFSTDDDGSCLAALDGFCETCSGEIDGSGIIVDNDADNDSVCDDVDDCVSTGAEHLIYDIEDNEVDPFLGGYDECEVCNGDGIVEGFNCDGESLSLLNDVIPENFNIHNIYPNPFNPVTNIIYGLPEYVNVQIIVYNTSGKQIETLINQFQAPGYHSINWNADSNSSGVYFVKMVAGSYVNTQKLILVK